MALLVEDAHALAALIEKADGLIAESKTAAAARQTTLWREVEQIIRELRLIRARYYNSN